MFVLKQPRPQHLTLIMKNLAQNGRAFEQILVKKKQTFLSNHDCLCFLYPD